MAEFTNIELNELQAKLSDLTQQEEYAIQMLSAVEVDLSSMNFVQDAAKGIAKEVIRNMLSICNEDKLLHAKLCLTLFADGKVTLYHSIHPYPYQVTHYATTYRCYYMPRRLTLSRGVWLDFQRHFIEEINAYLGIKSPTFAITAFPRAQWQIMFS